MDALRPLIVLAALAPAVAAQAVTAGPDDDTVQLTGTTEVGGTESISLGGGET